MKRNLPRISLERVWRGYPRPFEFFKRLFPGKKLITARDVLKVPARKFKRKGEIARGGFTKSILAYKLMPEVLQLAWDHYDPTHDNEPGSSADIKIGLKLCDQYERGEIPRELIVRGCTIYGG